MMNHLTSYWGEPPERAPPTSGTPLNSYLYVSLLAYVWPYTHICIRAQNSCSMQVDTMDPSLSNSMPMELLNATGLITV